MIPNNISNSGPRFALGDVNGDRLEDIFIAASRGSESALYRQLSDGTFVKSNGALPESNGSNDKDAVFLDADGDGDQDLYIASGGNEFEDTAEQLQDRLLINDGRGNFKQNPAALPQMITSSSTVTTGDFNSDGHIDIFVGGRSVPGKYPLAPRSYLLKNNGKGTFEDVTEKFCPALLNPGMVTDAQFADVNGDKFPDLLVVGEWMEASMYFNKEGRSFDLESDAFGDGTAGWWLTIEGNDFDGDGDTDFVLGNFGLNNQYHVDAEHPAKLLYKDFDNNGSIDPIFHYYVDDTLAFAYSSENPCPGNCACNHS